MQCGCLPDCLYDTDKGAQFNTPLCVTVAKFSAGGAVTGKGFGPQRL